MAERQQLRDQAEETNLDADRYYAEMCRRPALREPAQHAYADLARARDDHAGAARHDAHMNAMFPAFAHRLISTPHHQSTRGVIIMGDITRTGNFAATPELRTDDNGA